MNGHKVPTQCGLFDRERFESLRDTLRQATEVDGMSRDQVVKFEGQDLLISYGQYLAEYVEGQLIIKESGL